MKKINIAIEGPVASGKGTIAWQLAQKLDYLYMDTGALYRALTLSCLDNNIDIKNEHEVTKFVNSLKLEYNQSLDTSKAKCQILVNGKDVTPLIRTQRIADNVYYLAGYDKARTAVINLERELSSKKGTVIEGRAVIDEAMPDAELKIYLTANILTRAKRRHADLIKIGEKITLDEVTKRIEERDNYDQSREFGRLTVHQEAFTLDTSDLTIDQVVDILYLKAHNKIIN
ncbi:MAG: (d)CMP kinase [bacterium]|nr:(d)CMP kinase [bacterium]